MSEASTLDIGLVAAEITAIERPEEMAATFRILHEQQVERKILSRIFQQVIQHDDPAIIERAYAATADIFDPGFRSALSAEAFLRLGQREKAMHVVNDALPGSQTDMMFQRRRLAIMHRCQSDSDVNDAFESLMEGGRDGLNQVISIVHNLIEENDLGYAQELWERISQHPAADQKVVTQSWSKIKSKFGKKPFEKPDKIESDDPNAYFQQCVALLASPSIEEGEMTTVLHATRTLPRKLGMRLWQHILARDPSKRASYERFLGIRNSKKQALEEKPMTVSQEDQQESLPKGTETVLDQAQRVALVKLAVTAGKEGGMTRIRFDDLVSDLERSGGLSPNDVRYLQMELEDSIERFHRSDNNDRERKAWRSRAFKRALPKRPTFQNRQTERALRK